MNSTKVNELYEIRANDNEQVVAIIRNKTTQKLSKVLLNNNTNIFEYCYNNNIDASSYKKLVNEDNYDNTSDNYLRAIIQKELDKLREKTEPIPQWQVDRYKINPFVYFLLVFKGNVTSGIYKYSNKLDLQYKLSKRMYLKYVYNIYTDIKKRYFNNEFYKTLACRNLNKNIYRFILANI